MTEVQTLEIFLPLVDTDFTVRGDGLEDTLRLTAAAPLNARSVPAGHRVAFVLSFDGTRTDAMIANLIEISHPEIEPFLISLSAFGRLPDGAFQYEAVFN